MKINIILPTRFIPIFSNFYVDSYNRYLHRFFTNNLWVDEKHRKYTRKMYLNNIRRVLSVNAKNLTKIPHYNESQSSYEPWEKMGYHSFYYEHWYFAYMNPFVAPDGNTYVEVKDIKYEGEYHNDTMSEPVYLQESNNKIKLTESQLRKIIRESIIKILNVS